MKTLIFDVDVKHPHFNNFKIEENKITCISKIGNWINIKSKLAIPESGNYCYNVCILKSLNKHIMIGIEG
jgi:hypothetical protein